MKKKFLAGSIATFILIVVVFMVYAASPYKEERTIPEKSFTVTELAKFTGKDGARAYVAYNGIVYDITDEKTWKGGSHKGNDAGIDITDKLNKIWHGPKVMKKHPVVGKLVK